MRLPLIFISLLLASCNFHKKGIELIDNENVAFIEIRKYNDTASFRLTYKHTADLIKKLNSAKHVGLSKFFPQYFVTIHFTKDSIVTLKTNGDNFKIENDFTYSVNSKEFFKNLWLKQLGIPDNYYEYQPIKFANDEFEIDNNPISENYRNAIKQVFKHYNQKFIEKRGYIFYENKIDQELLWNYTTKANDSIWLMSHK
jgi:hypothetical protein